MTPPGEAQPERQDATEATGPRAIAYGPAERTLRDRVETFLRRYAWWIAKNVLGWTLILVSPVLGAAVPGPGGIPIFLIGFAMVTFPGKRGLTARVFRGIPIDVAGGPAGVFSGMAAMLVPLAATLVVVWQFPGRLDNDLFRSPYKVGGLAVAAMVASYGLAWVSLRLANVVVGAMPRVRRFTRPWMRRKGIDLLPPRRRKRLRATTPHAVDQEILEIDPAYQQAAAGFWKRAKPWLRRLVGLGLVAGIIYYMLRPVRGKWHEVGAQVLQYDPWRFIVAVLIFAAFLFFWRCLTWLKMIKGFGYRVPLAAGTRVWSTGELARYLPGTVWQILGRVHLLRPYGVPPSVCSTTQVLDIATFLLANLLLGMGCVFWFWNKAADGGMRPYLIGGAALLPLLALGLHPKIFYGIANRVMTGLKKEPFSTRLRGKKLTKYFAWYLVGLLVQSVAIWVLLGDALHIKPDHWWKLAGPYCLAWAAGFTVGFMSPGGLGVRELVFVGMLSLTLDQANRDQLPQGEALMGFLLFCSVLLRLWTIAAELLVAGAAYLADYKGAMNRADAPGRVKTEVAVKEATTTVSGAGIR